MQEDINHRTVALVIRTGKLTADALAKAMRMYLDHRKQVKASKEPKHGKISVNKLLGKDQGATTLAIDDNNIKPFERIAKKYNIDFAVKKDKTETPPKYVVFFKGRDADVIAMAFKEFIASREKQKDKPSLKEQLSRFKDVVEMFKKKELVKEKAKTREQAL